MSEVTVVEVDTKLVCGMRRTGKYQEIAKMFPVLFQHAVKAGAQFAGHPMFICHEMTIEDVKKADEEGNADIEVVVPISAPIKESDEVKCYELPGGTMAKIIHKGPYEACEPTYLKLYAWIEENNKKITGPTREAYLNDPKEVTPEETLTEIYAPIE
jgi:effector-binding domain-containing protein